MVRFRKPRPWRRLLPLALLAGFALAAAAMSLDSGTTQLPATVRAGFGLCHEGGGTNCVVDGDTLWIAGQKLRIAGIDAPETHEPGCPAEAALGKAAAEKLRKLLNSGTVTTSAIDRDKDSNGRLLRNVAVDGKDVGAALIAAGLARRYRGAKKAWC